MCHETYALRLLIFCVLTIVAVRGRPNYADLQVRSVYTNNTSQPYNNNPLLKCNPCRYVIGLISDDDHKSRSHQTKNQWQSKFSKATIELKSSNMIFTVGKINDIILTSNVSNEKGLGMELSELIYFNGNLLTIDDKTGIVYKIVDDHVEPWVTLVNCMGTSNASLYKSEWATVYKDRLYVGSAGFAWFSSNKNETEPNCGPQWIKAVSANGHVANINWKTKYSKIQNATKCKGYITHESGVWSNIHKKWFFAPRKCSSEPFNSKTDDQKGSNLLITVDAKFRKIDVIEVGPVNVQRGFSSFKFLPGSEDTIIVALKTYEDDNSFQTYITAFNINGTVYLPDTCLSNVTKFEGVEFLTQKGDSYI